MKKPAENFFYPIDIKFKLKFGIVWKKEKLSEAIQLCHCEVQNTERGREWSMIARIGWINFVFWNYYLTGETHCLTRDQKTCFPIKENGTSGEQENKKGFTRGVCDKSILRKVNSGSHSSLWSWTTENIRSTHLKNLIPRNFRECIRWVQKVGY